MEILSQYEPRARLSMSVYRTLAEVCSFSVVFCTTHTPFRIREARLILLIPGWRGIDGLAPSTMLASRALSWMNP